MAKGGARSGAGRKAGTVNKTSREAYEKAKAEGVLPLDYMLQVMRDPSASTKRRDAMAEKSARYVHPTLTAIKHSGDKTDPVMFQMINRPPKE